jgi:hypothetical protein
MRSVYNYIYFNNEYVGAMQLGATAASVVVATARLITAIVCKGSQAM